MRRLGRSLASACCVRNLICLTLLGVSVWAAGVGLLPIGPRPSEAVEAKLVTEVTAPSASDRQIARLVASMMRRDHLTKHPLDDEISRRALDLFLKSLDSRKLYFYQSDVDEFNQRRNDLDDMVSRGDVSFAYVVFNRLLKRIDERLVTINQLLGSQFDFEADEVLVSDSDKLAYPATPDEARNRWLKQLKYDTLVLKADKSNKEDIRERLKRRYQSLVKRMHQTDSNELLEMFLTAITSSFDPHSTYMAPDASENFDILISTHLQGIGAQLKAVDGYTVIDKLIPGGPAEKNGQLKVGDRVISVAQGDDGEPVDVVDMKLNDVVRRIRGKENTIVRLGVLPEGASGAVKTIKITRAQVDLKDAEASGTIIEDGKKADGTPFKLGVINLPSFYMDMKGARGGNEDYKSCSRDVRRLIEDFNRKGADALVLDLRKNGGGSLTEAISLTGLFIEQGPVVQVKDPDGRIQQYDDTDRSIAWRGPLIVMISKFSASASEILAGAIQDYHRGLIVGDSSTHGKGTVQTMMDLGPLLFRINNPENLGSLKLTVQQFYRPSGDSTQQRGVLADVVLPSLTDHYDVSEGDLDYPVAFDKVPAVPYKKYDTVYSVNPNTVSALKEYSTERIEKSADFARRLKEIKLYEEQKAKKEIPLNEKKFLARRAEFDAQESEEKTLDEHERGATEVFKRDYYGNEVLSITLDYLRLLGKDKVAADARTTGRPN
jgi:carboxyl-terminal processing protease